MEQLGISNAVDTTGAFRIPRVATPDVSSCSGFRVWYVRRPLRKLATKTFRPCSYFGRTSQCLFVRTESNYCLFLYMRHKRVLYCIIYCANFLIFQFPWNIWSFANKKKMAELLPMEHHRTVPIGHFRNHAFCYKFPVLYQILHLLFKC